MIETRHCTNCSRTHKFIDSWPECDPAQPHGFLSHTGMEGRCQICGGQPDGALHAPTVPSSARCVDSFTGDYAYAFLSNGWEGHPFIVEFPVLDGVITEPRDYRTGEHLYQALKAPTMDQHDWVRAALKPFGPDGAKRRGRSVAAGADWEERKYDAMVVTLAWKFHETYQPEMCDALLRTGDALLVEGNTWGDTCWGVCNGVGRNWLGILLMARRAELRARRT